LLVLQFGPRLLLIQPKLRPLHFALKLRWVDPALPCFHRTRANFGPIRIILTRQSLDGPAFRLGALVGPIDLEP